MMGPVRHSSRFHGGSSPPGHTRRTGARTLVAIVSLLALVWAVPAPAQESGTAPLPTDSADLRDRARELQAGFEAFREARIPPTPSRPTGGCDERIGRFCLRHGGDEAPIPPEPIEVGLAKRRLIDQLARIQERIPGDGWILGQRIFYQVEAGGVRAAERVARTCEGREAGGWWCDALLGYALHADGRFVAADSAFAVALGAMPDEVRAWYETPEFILDGEGRELFQEAESPARDDLWRRLWLLSDPLYLVEGNDRRTAHMARKTLVRIREGTLTAYGLPFDEDRDLEELNVRYGGERGYERVQGAPTPGVLRDTRQVVGRHHPQDREYLPAGSFLADPARIPPGAWTLEEDEPRSGYAAPYALDVRPLAAQVARFRRGDSLLVVAAYRTGGGLGAAGGGGTSEAERRDPGPAPSAGPTNPFFSGPEEPPSDPGPGSGADPSPDLLPEGPVESGVFVLGWDGAPAFETRHARARDVIRGTVPNGEYVFGLEVLERDAGRAWRTRQGLRQESLAPGQSAVSDLLFLEDAPERPESLEEALPLALSSIRIRQGTSFKVAWEVYGLRPGEQATVTLGFTEGEPDLLRRIGEYLRLVRPEEPVEIRFEDQGPDRLGTVFRALDVDVPSFEPGVYTLNLSIELAGRTPMTASRRLTVVE